MSLLPGKPATGAGRPTTQPRRSPVRRRARLSHESPAGSEIHPFSSAPVWYTANQRSHIHVVTQPHSGVSTVRISPRPPTPKRAPRSTYVPPGDRKRKVRHRAVSGHDPGTCKEQRPCGQDRSARYAPATIATVGRPPPRWTRMLGCRSSRSTPPHETSSGIRDDSQRPLSPHRTPTHRPHKNARATPPHPTSHLEVNHDPEFLLPIRPPPRKHNVTAFRVLRSAAHDSHPPHTTRCSPTRKGSPSPPARHPPPTSTSSLPIQPTQTPHGRPPHRREQTT